MTQTLGCTDSTAENYVSKATATDPDRPCLYLGCTDSTAVNFDPSANTVVFGLPGNSWVCTFQQLGCLDSTMEGYNPSKTAINTHDPTACYIHMCKYPCTTKSWKKATEADAVVKNNNQCFEVGYRHPDYIAYRDWIRCKQLEILGLLPDQ